MSAEALTPWARASLAATLFALNPLGSGIQLRASAGPVRDAWLDQLGAALAPRQILRIPAEVGDDRLIGGLDVAATLRAGRPVAEPGLLTAADGGVIAVAMAERMRASVAARLCLALDCGKIALQRDGLSAVWPARIGVVALDEGQRDEAAPPSLIERLAFIVDLDFIGWRDVEAPVVSAEELSQARVLLPRVSADEETMAALVAVAAALGIASLRAPMQALRAAHALAALRGAVRTEAEDAELAAALVLAPRATQLPAQAEPPEPESDEPPQADENPAQLPRELEDRVLEAARAALPPGLLALLAAGAGPRRGSSMDGKSGAEKLTNKRGRPLGSRPGSLSRGRLDLVATLRAAAPWRRARDPENRNPARAIVRPDDIRIVRYRERRGSETIFVVDASGSLAMNRLAEVKGAVELLLADCYIRRDQVALIAFRGKGVEIALPPTRSMARARRALAGLPGGGGTPIAAGLDAAVGLAEAASRKGRTPFIVLMSDGRANIGRDGAPGRPQAMRDALEAARRVRSGAFAAMAIETSAPLARDDAVQKLADAMGAAYVKLPFADAAGVNAAVRSARPS